MRTNPFVRISPCVFAALTACGQADPQGAAESSADTATIHEEIVNGAPLSDVPSAISDPAVVVYANLYSYPQKHCSATLLTNTWVLTSKSCQSTDGSREIVTYNTACTRDSDCGLRFSKCTSIGKCGATVGNKYHSSDWANDPNELVDLWQLQTPISSATTSGVQFSIAQPIYYGTKDSLRGKPFTLLGAGGSFPTITAGGFGMGSFNTYGYGLITGSYSTAAEDDGGPGYYRGQFPYLAGVTQGQNTQQDLMKVQPWIDDTLFDRPRVIRSGVLGYTQALSYPGAVAAYLDYVPSDVYTPYYLWLTSCSAEPCDARGNWSAPFKLLASSDPLANPSVTMEPNGKSRIYTLVAGLLPVDIAYTPGDPPTTTATYMSGSQCKSIAAYTRPLQQPVPNPLIDLVCTGTDGNVYYNARRNGSYVGWSSIGQPSVGIKPGSNVALTDSDPATLQVVVVGNDGAAWLQTGNVTNGWRGWASLGGSSITAVAVASYANTRIDVIVNNTGGNLYHRAWESGIWLPNWNLITRGAWSSTSVPFAASIMNSRGRLNIGALDASGNAQVQRYNDWQP